MASNVVEYVGKIARVLSLEPLLKIFVLAGCGNVALLIWSDVCVQALPTLVQF